MDPLFLFKVIILHLLLLFISSRCRASDGWLVTGNFNARATRTPPCQELCFSILGDTVSEGDLVGLYGCFDISDILNNQRWRYENFTLSIPTRFPRSSRLCMSASLQNNSNSVYLEVCRQGKPSQYWEVDDLNKTVRNGEQLYLQALSDTTRRFLSPLQVSTAPETNSAFTFLEYGQVSLQKTAANSTGVLNGNFASIASWSYQFLPQIQGRFPFSVCSWIVGNTLRDMQLVDLQGAGCPTNMKGLNLNTSNSVSQAVFLEKGQQYFLSFQHGGVSCPATGNVDISQGQLQLLQTNLFTSLNNGACKTERFVFNSTVAGDAFLKFQASGSSCGPVLTNILLGTDISILGSTNSPEGSDGVRKSLVVGAFILASVLLVVVACLSFIIWKLTRLQRERTAEDARAGSCMKRYSFKDIKTMTNNFQQCIGKGGFASVFLARAAKSGAQYAVKMFQSETTDVHVELDALGRIHHKCIVECHGYCLYKDKLYLVLEYMSNGSLHDHLHKAGHRTLGWKKRVKIAKDVAQGLAYLHHGANPPIVHRDVKPANVLLDEDFSAKLADFGISRESRFVPDGDQVATTKTYEYRGTLHYMDMQALQTVGVNVSGKTDVYSYGITLLEIISGRKAEGIVVWVKSTQTLEDVADPELYGLYDIEELKALHSIAMLCVDDYDNRPVMSKILDMVKDLDCVEQESLAPLL